MYAPNDKVANPWGFASIGTGCAISPYARFYGVEHITLGDRVRIDDFCILSASKQGMSVGNYVHISCYTYVVGQEAFTMEDYSALSGRCGVYTSNDNYEGLGLVGPMVPESLRAVYSAPVVLKRHALVGAGSIILPGVVIEEGGCCGAMSLLIRRVPTFQIWGGIPAHYIKERSRKLLALEDMHKKMGVVP